MTVEEAKKKWCPMAMLVFNSRNFASGNRFEGESQDTHDQCCCFGPDCMVWAGDDTQGECGLANNDTIIEYRCLGDSQFVDSAKTGDSGP